MTATAQYCGYTHFWPFPFFLFFLYCTGVSMTTENEINAFSILNHTFCMAGPHYCKTGKKLNCEIWFTDIADQNEHGLIWLQYRSTSKLVHIPEIKTPLLPSFRHVYQSLSLWWDSLAKSVTGNNALSMSVTKPNIIYGLTWFLHYRLHIKTARETKIPLPPNFT